MYEISFVRILFKQELLIGRTHYNFILIKAQNTISLLHYASRPFTLNA